MFKKNWCIFKNKWATKFDHFFCGGGGVFAVFKLVQTPLRQSNRVTAMTDHELGLKLLLLLLDWLGTKSNVNGSVQHQSRFDAIYISKYIQPLQKMIDYKSIKQIVYVPFYTYFSIYEHLMIFYKLCMSFGGRHLQFLFATWTFPFIDFWLHLGQDLIQSVLYNYNF